MVNDQQKNSLGLSSEEALRRLDEFGPNRIAGQQKTSFFGIARHEVTEPMILLLLVVGIFYSVWGKLIDSFTIFGVIFLLVFAEVYNEYRAKKAIASLEKIAAPHARVIRDGGAVEIETEEVVPGDMVILSVGTRVAADSRIRHALGIQVNEAALTGESFPRDRSEGDEVYAGTIVLSGEGQAEVFATGGRTRLGQIASAAQQVRHPRTPLQTAMKSLVAKLVYVAVFFSVIIPVVGLFQGRDAKTMILTGLSLAFATIPEELPIIITMVLGLGAYTLSRNHFLVKRLRAAETLGNATVIVTDKTGTITEGELKIVSLYPEENAAEILRIATGSASEYVLTPLEKQIRERAEGMGVETGTAAAFRQRNFGYNNKKTKAVIRHSADGYELFLSGAPEEVFNSSRGVPPEAGLRHSAETDRGRRVIAVAHRKLGTGMEHADFSDLEKDMDFVGLISFEDSPRKGVRETITDAAHAGIRTIMVTGDHASTAGFVAREVGISADKVYTGRDIEGFRNHELRDMVKDASVFARTSPEHKYRIVKALQDDGEVVAVTGDGINDVLALKGADIGIAMGIRGTDVAKDAAEVVLADDNYITITQGIFEGRKFFDNLQKGIKYYLSVKTALIMIFLLPVFFGMPMPFSPIQIVVLELFMDLAASAGFVAEPGEKGIFSRPPRRRTEEVLSGAVVRGIFFNGVTLFIAVMAAYGYARYLGLGLAQTQTFAFSAWIFGHIMLAFISRSERESVFSLGVFANRIIDLWAVAAIAFLLLGIFIPFLRGRFHLAPVSFFHVALVALMSFLIVGSLEARKALSSQFSK
jgi:Ca2+-transporting ATPase